MGSEKVGMDLMNELDETLEIFFAETEDLISTSEESLMLLEADPYSKPAVEGLFRAIHTLKSGSAMVGFNDISEYAHLVENLLERVRSGILPVNKSLITFLLENIDFIHSMVDMKVSGKEDIDSHTLKTRKAQVNRFLGMDEISVEKKTALEVPVVPKKAEKWNYYKIDLKYRSNIFESGQDPILLLLNLLELGEFVEVNADLSKLPSYEEMSIYELYIFWQVILKSTVPFQEVETIFMFVKDDNDIEIEDVTVQYKDGVDLKVGEIPIGETLIEKSNITQQDLQEALVKQKKIGEILVEEKKIGKDTLQVAIVAQEESRSAYRKTSIRVEVKKMNYLVNLAEELGISILRMHSLIIDKQNISLFNIEQELENLLKINRDFQERVANVRMFSLEGTFRRFQRVARDTALELKKQIKTTMSGVETELDKEVIECITDPLKHLIRNCVDHGIELPEERIAAEKSDYGTIALKAYQQGGRIFVQISDDGRGIDLDMIRDKAVNMGIYLPDELNNTALANILCSPGFSTTSHITTISGRGVGMDVVKTQVEDLGGSIQVETKKGEGTTFTLAIPLTFALTDTLHFKSRNRSYIVPLWGVVSTEKFEKNKLRSFGSSEKVCLFKGKYIPIMDMSRVYGLHNKDKSYNEKVIVFFDTGTQEFGLIVDEIIDSRTVVVKSLNTNYRNVPGISGATIMGDGSVALVLDLFDLGDICFNKN
ncbi:MAG: hypothetical protein GQ559_02475 [Desulfobulbaceae bacterium]|nr:hypothetical protein [Desulfobulbaceae bacterium]